MKNITIVLPMYNEAENVDKIIWHITEEIAKIEQEKKYNMNILVVDDYSPDGTGNKIKDIQNTNSKLHLIQKQKEGLGKAYIEGFKFAIEKLNADFVMEMDSDFSHSPSDIKRFTDEIENGYSFIIGSRYIEGGSIPSNWPYLRILNSKYGNIFARWIAGLKDVHDCTSGFRLIDTNFLKKIDLNKINAKGYAFQMNILYELVKLDIKVKEIPIAFVDRTFGKSKLGRSDVIEFIKNSFCILINRIIR